MSDIIELSELPNASAVDSVNCGGEFELLMNDNLKKRSEGHDDNHNIHLDELTNLDEELHNLSFSETKHPSSPIDELFNVSSLEGLNDNKVMPDTDNTSFNVKFAGSDNINLETSKSSETWDGFSKFNNVPINPDKPVANKTPSLTKEEILEQKFEILQKIRAFEDRGGRFSKNYTMESSLSEMCSDYKAVINARRKRLAVKGYGEALLSFVTTIEEFSTDPMNPFSINLDGMSDKVSESVEMGDYEDDFEALHEKYKNWNIGPEMNIAYKLGMSGALICATNSILKKAPPSMERVFRENPDMMRNFQSAVANTMQNDENPAMSHLGGRMGQVHSSNNHPRTYAPPPPISVSTQRQKENSYNHAAPTTAETSQFRPEMTGPGDISDILNSYKTSSHDILGSAPIQPSYQPKSQYPPQTTETNKNNSSTISISDMKEIQTSGKGKLPKKTRQKKGSRSSTISINI